MTQTTNPAADLTADERAALTAGVDMWHTAGVDRLGIAGMAVTDGPSGARGALFSGSTSTLLPCGTALASTWNPELIQRVGRLLGDEARSKGARLLLAPTVNIHRHPLGGRNFECYSEDPHLTAEIAVAFIEGVQSRGVGCAIKHFAANDQETDRMSIDVQVDEQTLREIYLAPFEAAVRRAGTWGVMAAYNRLGGEFCSEHHELLTRILRDEWGFDGMVISDWFGTRSAAAVEAGLDLEMPGPPQFLGHHLAPGPAVDRAAERVLHLLDRTTTDLDTRVDPALAATLTREAAGEGIVLLSNNGVLPLPATTSHLAVLGARASRPHVQGGGSAQVTPPYIVTPVQGITERAGADAVVNHETGRVDLGPAVIDRRYLALGEDGSPGTIRLDFHPVGAFDQPPLRTYPVANTNLIWLGEPAPGVPAGRFSARATATFSPDSSGPWTFSLASLGDARLFIDGALVLDTSDAEPGGGGLMGLFSTPQLCTLDLAAASSHELVAEIDVDSLPPATLGDGDGDNLPPLTLAGLTLEVAPPPQPDAVERAVAAARAAEVAVVVVGHDLHETEGVDHATIDLPADQVALIHQVAAANPATVVVLNTGSPVSTDWADDVAAVVQMSYPGQEAGAALAAVLFGDVDPSGRLPTTYPRRIEDSPAHANFPGQDGTVTYAEGLFVGYRHYDTHGVEPRYCFGHGLSYTIFSYSAPTVEVDGHTATITVDVTNTGERAGREVVQAYVRHVGAGARPDRELRAFRKVALDPGETTTVTLTLDQQAFADWCPTTHAWQVAPGPYDILVGSSSRAIHHTLRVALAAVRFLPRKWHPVDRA